MKHDIIISLGSNYHAPENIQHAKRVLQNIFGDIVFSQVLSTEPIGMGGPNFLNCLCRVSAMVSLAELFDITKYLEAKLGDNKEERENGRVEIDIDVLRYDEQLFHPADWERPYIPQLLRDLDILSQND